MLRNATTTKTLRGTPGYVPFQPTLEDGSVLWDVWSLAMIIVESDLEHDIFMKINSERHGLLEVEKYTKEKTTCKSIRRILNSTVTLGNIKGSMKLEEIKELLLTSNFRKFR